MILGELIRCLSVWRFPSSITICFPPFCARALCKRAIVTRDVNTRPSGPLLLARGGDLGGPPSFPTRAEGRNANQQLLIAAPRSASNVGYEGFYKKLYYLCNFIFFNRSNMINCVKNVIGAKMITSTVNRWSILLKWIFQQFGCLIKQ